VDRRRAIRDILVGIDETAAGESRLRLALSLARDHKAYLAAAGRISRAERAPRRVMRGNRIYWSRRWPVS
jgi:hypothetical protein